jgi:GNAT superfamily N-acetyltransferase
MTPAPQRITADDPAVPACLALLTRTFAYMEGRIDPPSSLTRMTLDDMRHDAARNELWVIPGPLACVILTAHPDHLYIGKLAVDATARGQGLSRMLIDHAEQRAKALGLPQLRLQTRVELTENHAAFQRMGFVQIGSTAHEGYDRPTSLTFARELPAKA